MNGLHNQPSLADALDQALAGRGSAPAGLEHDLSELLELARVLEGVGARVGPTDEFRVGLRHRLLTHVARSSRQRHSPRTLIQERSRAWAIRVGAAIAALLIAGGAAAGASASALPGDPLYPVKQVTESTALELAPTDSARQDLLLYQADTRLDETAQLLQQGRDADAAATIARYNETLAALSGPATSEAARSHLGSNESRLDGLLQSAPPSVRPGLQRALGVTERGLGKGRSSSPTTDEESAATPVPASTPPQSESTAEMTGPPPAGVGSSASANHGEHGAATKPEGPAASHRDDSQRVQPTPLLVESHPRPADVSSIGPDDSQAPRGIDPASRPDANANRTDVTGSGPIPRANAPQPVRTEPRGGGASRPASGGRGRP